METILTRVGISDAQLRVHCQEAVQDELSQSDGQLRTALCALHHALKVVVASRELHKSPQSLSDTSTAIATRLSSVVASCNEIGPLVKKLHHALSSSAVEDDDVSSSATEDEEDLEEDTALEDVIIVQEDINTTTEAHELVSVSTGQDTARATAGVSVETSSPPDHQPRASSRKRTQPERYLNPQPPLKQKKVSKEDLVQERLAQPRRGKLGTVMRSCLTAALDGHSDLILMLPPPCRMLLRMKERGKDISWFMDDIRAILAIAVPALSKRQQCLDRAELKGVLVLVESLPCKFREAAKLRKFIAATYTTPAREVPVIQKRLERMLKEVKTWCNGEVQYAVHTFEKRLEYVKDTIDACGYTGYDPREDQTIAELLFRLGCCLNVFGSGWAQDRRYDTIRALLFDMKSAERPR
ncbi:hypothetical protein PHYBOEH_012008 [Phytophthora boehmeriae]|uniref:Uncharacterized protein n=1 Tax=Phytophthora boehmeriae TaxID=109152 RepID=A0A8T1VDC1_9STRA|nr:hypothetical protein PHYBOEH_012008 [Phytophthora boehmeriae]